MLALTLIVLSAANADGVPEKGRARYLEAVEKLSARQYGRANDLLNSLAGELPQVAEVFASRCSAQLGLQHWAAAEADCAYTLKLKPLPTAIYGLAVAEDGQKKYVEAVTHYRQYAGLAEASAELKQQAMARADLLATRVPAAALPPAGGPTEEAAPPPPPPPDKKAAKATVAVSDPGMSPPPLTTAASDTPSKPPPGGAKGQFIPGVPDPGEGLVYVYRSVSAAAATVATLFVDNARVGDLRNDRYFELRLRPGSHTVMLKTPAAEQVLPIDVVEGELAYLKLEHAPKGADAAFKPSVTGKQGRKEIRDCCELVFSKKL
ncbi:MAG: DUF2846 domain-containing protein [Archangiaceae bacterium]|nr:DUF2846 domain-containing protein [Archangiaceae bacterium]